MYRKCMGQNSDQTGGRSADVKCADDGVVRLAFGIKIITVARICDIAIHQGFTQGGRDERGGLRPEITQQGRGPLPHLRIATLQGGYKSGGILVAARVRKYVADLPLAVLIKLPIPFQSLVL